MDRPDIAGSQKNEFKLNAGQNLVEFAFVLPIFLILLAVISGFCSLFFTQIVLLNAAWEGARAGATITDPDRGDEEICGAVYRAAYGLDEDRLMIEIEPSQTEYPRNQAFPAPRGAPLQITLQYLIKLPGTGIMVPMTSRAVTTMEYQNP